jgi:deoxyribose-phosphate aldolase
VYPALVPVAVAELTGTGIGVASVAAGFPAGLTPLAARLLEIEGAVADGADEIDVVINRSAFLTGDLATVAHELASMRAACPDQAMKVILETGELGSTEAIASATDLAIAAGAQFVKTSTGKMSPAATPESVTAIAERLAAHHRATGDRVGLKVSGGVRTAEDAIAYLELVGGILGEEWLDPARFRFGASKLLGALVDAIENAPPAPAD